MKERASEVFANAALRRRASGDVTRIASDNTACNRLVVCLARFADWGVVMVEVSEEFVRWKASQAEPWCEAVRGAAIKQFDALENFESLKLAASAIGAVRYSDMPRSSNISTDAIPKAVASIETAEAELMELISDYADMLKEFTRATNLLNDRYSHLLQLRYVQRLPWNDIAKQMNYVESYVRGELKVSALAALYETMPHQYRSPMEQAI